MKLSEWAKRTGVSYHTAYHWFKDGNMPVPAYQTATGTIIVEVPADAPDSVAVIYARVSSAGQADSLDGQVASLVVWATSQGVSVDRVVKEVGSALNGSRRKFQRLLADQRVNVILVEHRDRAVRFGFDYLQASLSAQNRKIMVMDDTELEDDLVRDMTEVLTSLCARVYGKRGAKKRAEAALGAAKSVDMVGDCA